MIDNVEPRLLIEKVAEKLKTVIDMPEWAKFVKTGVNRQRPPVNDNWWFCRAASILRTVENKGPIGVAKLRTKYGGKKNNGMAPEHFRKSSGKIIRTILQQLEVAKLIKQETVGTFKGRVITGEGSSLLFSTSKELIGEKPKKSTPKPVKKKETKPAGEKKEDVKKSSNKKEINKFDNLVASQDKKEVSKEKVKPKEKEVKKEDSKKEVVKEKPDVEDKKEENKEKSKDPIKEEK